MLSFIRNHLFSLVAFIIAAISSVALTIVAYESGVSSKVKEVFFTPASTPPIASNTKTYTWRTVETGLHSLAVAEIDFGEIDGFANGGGISSYKGGIIFSSPQGQLGFLDLTNGKIIYSGTRVPMNLAGLQKSKAWQATIFNRGWFRVSSILTKSVGEQDWLLVSHHFYNDDEQICTRISKTQLTYHENSLSISNDWQLVHDVNPCVDLKERNYEFAGHLVGGRLENVKNEPSVLMTVGDHGYGYWDPARFTNGHHKEWSSLLKISLFNNSTELVVTGLRNPQGLHIDDRGRLWETEHGPQGGDEINLIKPGLNYGWPNVSYGMEYADNFSPRKPVQNNIIQGSHEGYQKPVKAFVPSIGISQITSVSKTSKVFPLWRGDLLMVSMKEKTLYRMRLEEDRIVYAEPIFLNHRMRDITRLPDGTFAVLSEQGKILILSNAKTSDNPPITIAGYAPIIEKLSLVSEVKGVEWQRDMLRWRCGSCHSVDGTPNIGPPLNNIIGRKIGAIEGFPYSEALRTAKGQWTKEKLLKFVQDPSSVGLGGSAMPSIDATFDELRGAIDYADTQ